MTKHIHKAATTTSPATAEQTVAPQPTATDATATTAAVEQPTPSAESEPFYHNPEFSILAAFIIFIAVFVKYVLPIINKSLDDRASTIRNQLEQANRLRAEAEALLASYEQERAEKIKEAETILAAAKKEAAALRERASQELEQLLEHRREQALDRIARAEQQAVAAIRDEMVEAATKATAEVIRSRLEKQPESDPAIERALSAIERNLH
jgi:F-type H+-transporting ATPase subunit b